MHVRALCNRDNGESKAQLLSGPGRLHFSWVVAHSEVILGQVLRNPVAVEKVGFSKKSQKSGERKCLGD
jgi:hypothetical protein